MSAAWAERIVPLAVEFGPFESKSSELGGGHLLPGGVLTLVQGRADLQTTFRPRVGNQINNDCMAHQGAPTPILGDLREHPVLDLVPLAGARRKVTHGNLQAR